MVGPAAPLGAISPQWGFVALYAALGVCLCAGAVGLSHLLGPRRRSPGKLDPYECGVPILSDTRWRFSVKFYLVAIFFLLFDIEAVFLVPWVLGRQELAAAGLAGPAYLLVFLFVAILTLALVYLWKRGALEWD